MKQILLGRWWLALLIAPMIGCAIAPTSTTSVDRLTGDATSYYQLGNILLSKDMPERAIFYYSKAIENPGISMLYFNRTAAYKMKEEYDKAWRDVHRA